MKIWIDDIRPAPVGYVHFESVSESKAFIAEHADEIEVLDMDHDAGDFAQFGGDYVRLLDWLEAKFGSSLPFPIRIHSMNPVGVANMRRIIVRNGWKEII